MSHGGTAGPRCVGPSSKLGMEDELGGEVGWAESQSSAPGLRGKEGRQSCAHLKSTLLSSGPTGVSARRAALMWP